MGLAPEPGSKTWAVDATVEVEPSDKEVSIATFTVEGSDGNLYGFVGTGAGTDLGYAFGPGTTSSGHLVFTLPEDVDVVRLVAEFSIYVGYDMVFE